MVHVALACTSCGKISQVDYLDPPYNKRAEDFACPNCGKMTCTDPTNL